MSLVDDDLVADYVAKGWWGTETLHDRVRANAGWYPDRAAFVTDTERMSWRRYDATGDRIAQLLMRAGFAPGDRVAVLLDDGPLVHAAYLGCERAGIVAIGLGARAGDRELRHLLGKTNARALLGREQHRGESLADRVAGLDVEGLTFLPIDDLPEADASDRNAIDERRLGPNDLFLLNSTSGTTGLPKCVTQFQNRWFFFHQLATRTGRLNADDVFMSVIPAAFGFGLWTAHFTPTILGSTTVVLPKFDAGVALQLMEQERVTVLCAVSTQFVMLLNHPTIETVDLSHLRALYTGGEAVPYERALEFERTTGAALLQFFGSNETGAFSGTALDDPQEKRLRTAGRVLPEMDVRLFDDAGEDVTASGGPAVPGGRGPALCAGYFEDDDANRQLYSSDGHMLMGDYVTIDAEGYLEVVGRKSDFIIRGGKNVSAAVVESEVGTHPAVDLVAAVAVPDAVFGERVCAVVTLRDGATLGLDDVVAHLVARGVTKDLIPEYLAVVDEMPTASGGKIAKGSLKDDIDRIVATAEAAPGITR